MSKQVSIEQLDDLLGLAGGNEVVKRQEDVDTTKKMVCLLIALGEPVEEVARKLGVKDTFIYNVITSTVGLEMVLRMQTACFSDPMVRVRKMQHMALDTQMKLLLTSKSDTVRANLSNTILDRAMGKAVQVVENRNFNMDEATPENIDKQLIAQGDRLLRLEQIEKRILAASPVKELEK